jgi:hypothetical protein
VDEGLKRRIARLLGELQPRFWAAQIGDGFGIVDAVVAMAAEQGGGHIRRAGGAREAREEEVRVVAPVAMAAVAGQSGARGLAAEGERGSKRRPADLDLIGGPRIVRRRQALGRQGAQVAHPVRSGREPARGMDDAEIGPAGADEEEKRRRA